MKRPESVREFLARRYENQRRIWLRGEGQWPLIIALGCPTESEAQEQMQGTLAWVSSWRGWQGAGEIIWGERRWRSIGTQSVPERLILNSPDEVAEWIEETERWRRARDRYHRFRTRWPALAVSLTRYFDVLADYPDADIDRLYDILSWLESHPKSNLYPRQLPVSGLDTKWLESRKALIVDLLNTLSTVDDCPRSDSMLLAGASNAGEFYRVCGLRPLPTTVRALILDAELRRRVGGFRDLAVRVDELSTSGFGAKRVYIIENVQTALAFEDLPDSIAIVGLGYGVDVLAGFDWLRESDCIYWGDIDTHGLAILSRAREFLPSVESFMMDEATLLRYRALWSVERDQVGADELPNLNSTERDLFEGLRQQRWGSNVRLEQERIDWGNAWRALRHVGE
jgi:hypothetical protein